VAVCYLTIRPMEIDVDLVCDGAPLMSHTYRSVEEAFASAQQDRNDLAALGWRADQEHVLPVDLQRLVS
jgi:hypothetical protein